MVGLICFIAGIFVTLFTIRAQKAQLPPPNYKDKALNILIQEANRVATELNLPEDLPIDKSKLTESFLLPYRGAKAWKSIGNVSTANYRYYVSEDNKFCFLERMKNQQEEMRIWRSQFWWPIERMDTNAALQSATQWLAACSMDVKKLNRDCTLHIYAATGVGIQKGDHFLPVYSIFWTAAGNEGNGSVASVRFFAPSNLIIQLRVDDPKYNLRKPLVAK